MTYIVCYAGGTCGDMLTALIDPTGATLNDNKIDIPEYRSLLKKPHLLTDEQKDLYIKNTTARSISSHDKDYHIIRRHKFIVVTVSSTDAAVWAATRFRNLHRDSVWKEMTDCCNASTVEDYAQVLIDFGKHVSKFTKYKISMESIISGNAVNDLKEYGIDSSGQDLYNSWLQKVDYGPTVEPYYEI